MSDRRNKREKEQLFNMPEIAKLEKKSFSGAMEKLEDSKLKKVLIWVFEIAVTLIFAVLTSMMLFQSVTMQESSMEPTLAVGSRYFVNKLAYKASSPKRGDLIVFRTNASDDAALHIRRVIGLPGETIQIVNGRILINGETYKEGKIFPRSTIREWQPMPLHWKRESTLSWAITVITAKTAVMAISDE